MSDNDLPRKRLRSCSPERKLPPEASTSAPAATWTIDDVIVEVLDADVILPTRDQDYYFPDGNFIVLVESTLFNVHRSILSRDISTFSTLFALPKGEGTEGSTDSNPIVLQGDTASEFRNFLWAMYALPHELRILFDVKSDIPKLFDIVKVSNKYCLRSIETWACDAIQASISRRTFSFDGAATEDREEITKIIRFAALLRQEQLLKATVNLLKQQFATSTGCLTFALNLCHELESDAALTTDSSPISMLIGEAYFSAMLRGPAFWDAAKTCLPPHARHRILIGHYRLSLEWTRIQLEPAPRLSHSEDCYGKGLKRCNAKWREFWEQNASIRSIRKVGHADIRGKMQAIQKEVYNWSDHHGNSMTRECKDIVKADLEVRIAKFEEELAGFFPKV